MQDGMSKDTQPHASNNLGEGGEGPKKKSGRPVLCRLGFHKFRVVDVTFGFGVGANVERVRCQRCGGETTRRAR
jgi:hypothetical protein